MSNWINNLKKKEDASDDASERQKELRLDNAKIIARKLPAFWDALVGFIRQDCAELRNAFPNMKRRHCHVQAAGRGFEIVNEGPLPRNELYIELNTAGQCIDLVESRKIDMLEEAVALAKARIEISADHNEELQCHYKNASYSTPESLAQALVSHVCEIE